jgi:hypothetical protein
LYFVSPQVGNALGHIRSVAKQALTHSAFYSSEVTGGSMEAKLIYENLKCSECSWTMNLYAHDKNALRVFKNSRQGFCLRCEKFTVHGKR